VTPVLLFVNASPGEVHAATTALPQALLQFHGDETPAECRQSPAAPTCVPRAWRRASIC
jgi:phosphoribosylanthranilate isomerase